MNISRDLRYTQGSFMHNNTANLNIMIKAARKASRSLIRDFNEVEKLQVVSKKAGDFRAAVIPT